MNYTFCKTCINEFDLDEIGDENACPHCGAEYEERNTDDELIEGVDEVDGVMGEFLADDGDWE